ncbi:MAG: vWA domain-containing protein [Acidimicrobiales bacterium]
MQDLVLFETAFADVFRDLVDPAEVRGDPNAPAPPPATRGAYRPGPPDRDRPAGHTPGADNDVTEMAPASEGTGRGDAADRTAVVAAASREERLASTDFSELSDQELAELYELMSTLRVSLPLRPGRRHHPHKQGDRLDLRSTLRRSRRSGGEPFHRITRRPRPRRRRLVVLCDISASMAPYSRAFVQLLHAARGSARAEVFTFATRLTRVTRAFETRRPNLALQRVAATAPDWRGGTRIGETMKEFVDGYGRGGMARGAVVVIVSDGWDKSPPGLLSDQLTRLDRLAHRIVWINPRTAAPGFEPLAGGMAAALPFCDALVAGNSLAALRAALPAISGLRARPRAPVPPPGRAPGLRGT